LNKYIFILLFFTFSFLKSQTNNNLDTEIKLEKKLTKWDTLKYRKFERVLILGFFTQYRNFNNEFEQLMNKDTLGLTKNAYFAESNSISGLVFNYDKISFSIGTRSQPQNESAGKGYTKVFNIGLNVGDNRWVSENYYRKFTGFYNRNTANFDSTIKKSGNYYLLPGLVSTNIMSRFMYFTNNKKYSFKSGFGCNYRQLKSAATFILGGSVNYFSLKNDSAIFPIQNRKFYNDFANFKGFSTFNISANFGVAATLVIYKAWFIGGYFKLGPEQQWRSYNLGMQTRNLSYVSWSGTGRASLGVNLKKFYMLFGYIQDYNIYNSPKTLNFGSASISGNFIFGWRFHTKTPKFYQKFMNTKLYSYL